MAQKFDPNNIIYEDRYKDHKKLDSMQTAPDKKKVIDFKQDYTVLIRKKLYYGITQKSNEEYIKIFQLNNFTSIRTSINVYGRPGSASITLKGGERVVVADREQIGKDGVGKWKSFDDVLNGWNSIDNEKYNYVDNPETSFRYEDLMKTREAKYGWAFAEKCDFEPMDEIYIFSKSHKLNPRTKQHDFIQIFFGYITQVKKDYAAGTQGLVMSINADDHLKLLDISRVANANPGAFEVTGVSGLFDGAGNMIFDDTVLQTLALDPNALNTDGSNKLFTTSKGFIFNNVFAGDSAGDIIKRLSLEAGVPNRFLTKRIEPVKRVPFMPQFKGGNNQELFTADYKTRLAMCQNAANILNYEFFADEEGNIVFKIPNYSLGINRMINNNMGLTVQKELQPPQSNVLGQQQNVNTNNQSQNQNQVVTKTETYTEKTPDKIYTVRKGDTLWDISKAHLGKGSLWPTIYSLNASVIGNNPNLIYPGQKLLIEKGKDVTKTREVTVNNNSAITSLNEKIKQDPQNTNLLTSNNTDELIPVIYPEQIISFSLVDSDKEVFNTVTVTPELPLIHYSMTSNPLTVTRTVQDWKQIVKFGFRMHPTVTTPLVSDADGAVIYGALLLQRSYANRYTGQLTIIEEPTIKVGDPIRFHIYDEYPFRSLFQTDSYKDTDEDNAQAVFYVDSIDRSINPSGVSIMTLSLRAGRMKGMPSIYDKCTELYRYFYEDLDKEISKPVQPNSATTSNSINASGSSSSSSPSIRSSRTYKVKPGDTLVKIATNELGSGLKWKDIWELNKKQNGGILTHQDRVYAGDILKLP